MMSSSQACSSLSSGCTLFARSPTRSREEPFQLPHHLFRRVLWDIMPTLNRFARHVYFRRTVVFPHLQWVFILGNDPLCAPQHLELFYVDFGAGREGRAVMLEVDGGRSSVVFARLCVLAFTSMAHRSRYCDDSGILGVVRGTYTMYPFRRKVVLFILGHILFLPLDTLMR